MLVERRTDGEASARLAERGCSDLANKKKEGETMKKMKNLALDLTATGMAMGVGGAVLSSVPGTANAQTAVGNLSGVLPMMGTIGGAGATLGALGSLSPKKKKGLNF